MDGGAGDRAKGPLVGIDTATRRAAIAIGDGYGPPVSQRSWEAGYRHGEELLAVLDELLREAGIGLSDVGGIVTGIGPGAFTGLRVGLATAKALAYGLHVPIVGVASTRALARAALASPNPRPPAGAGPPGAGPASAHPAVVAVTMPAGPHDRYLARYRTLAGQGDLEAVDGPVLVPGGEAIEPLVRDATLVAVDLGGRPGVDDDALVRGRMAQEGLGEALLAAGREALDRGEAGDVAALVPAYVTLPRGITVQTGAIEWSRDLR